MTGQHLLERLADRLRVVGPRLAARDSEAAHQVLAQVRAGLQRLADLAAEAEGRPSRVVPELAPHALGDVALVLGHDLFAGDLDGKPEVRAAAIATMTEISDLLWADR